MDTTAKVLGMVRDTLLILFMIIFLVLGIKFSLALADLKQDLNSVTSITEPECVGEIC